MTVRQRPVQPLHLAEPRQTQRHAGREAPGRARGTRIHWSTGADVLVQNLAPGAAARLGLTHEALSQRNPTLVVCDISGYGESGPFVQKKAYDLLIQAESGLISVTGTPTNRRASVFPSPTSRPACMR